MRGLKWTVRRMSAVMMILALSGCANYDSSYGAHAIDTPDPGAWYGQ
jgi:hypothetical protein